jgi:L-ribulose-5-phosphate 4-epimerase
MLIKTLREEVLEANREIVRRGLVLYTFGNVSAKSHSEGLIAIKPSGVPYESMKPADIVVTDLQGKVVEGNLRPSSDLATHVVLYKKFPAAAGVTHTHSEFATAWAQARMSIPCFGTTHADYFHGEIPVTDEMSPAEIEQDYELNTGEVIVRRFRDLDPEKVPAALVAGHGAFTWGKSAAEAAHNAVILESVARMAYYTLSINASCSPISRALHDKHYLRKHGKQAYYGQVSGKDK